MNPAPHAAAPAAHRPPPLVFPSDPHVLGESYCQERSFDIINARWSVNKDRLLQEILDAFFARFVQKFGFPLADPRVQAIALASFQHGLEELNRGLVRGAAATGDSARDTDRGFW